MRQELRTTESRVAHALESNHELRDDDFKLVCYIYEEYYGVRGLTFNNVMNNHRFYGLPSFETIRRARQKLQERHPLKYASIEKMRELRHDAECEFYDYAKGR